MVKVVMFGASVNAALLFETGGLRKTVEIVGCVDNSGKNIGNIFYQNIIKHPSEIISMNYDYVLITSRTNYAVMANQLISYNVPANKIIISYEEGHIEYFRNILGGNREQVLTRASSYLPCKCYNDAELMHDLINNNVITKIPIELIRATDINNYISVEMNSVMNNYFSDNEMDYQIYRSPYYPEFFEYISGESNNYPTNYFKLFRSEEKHQEEKIIIMRKEFYDKHMKLLQNGFSYYKNHAEPITVKYNKSNGFFSILDGLHRATFLYSKGIRYVYAMMSYNDYVEYINMDKITTVIKNLNNFKIKDLYGSILHPSFYNYPTLRDVTYPTRVEICFKELRGCKIRDKKIVDIGCNNGYNSRMFAREGACVTGIEMDLNLYELAKSISDLENTKVDYINKKFEDVEFKEEFNIALLMTVLYWYLDNQEILQAFLDKLNKNVSEMIIWESGDEPEKEKELILNHTKFKNYKKLSTTVGTGKLREFGIFTI